MTINPAISVIAAALVSATLAGTASWTVQSWRYDARIASLERDQQKGRADANADALSRLQADVNTVSEAATRAAAVAPQLTAQVGNLTKALKNATPLPAGCRPDADRVRHLTTAVRAANDSAAGQPTGGAVRPSP
jgi:hypothetical protein